MKRDILKDMVLDLLWLADILVDYVVIIMFGYFSFPKLQEKSATHFYSCKSIENKQKQLH